MILWLEDRNDTIRLPQKELSNLQIQIEVVATPLMFVTYLNDNKSRLLEIIGSQKQLLFIIDIMLHGILDLTSVGVMNAPTLSGNHTGYVFGDRFLRSRESLWRAVPIVFLTERGLDSGLKDDVQRLIKKGGGPVELMQKYVQTDLDKLVTFARQQRVAS